MFSAFSEIPKELDVIRMFPKWGGWAMLIGNPLANRGYKLPQFCDKLGLRRMDIIWVDQEMIPSSFVTKHGRGRSRFSPVDEAIDDGCKTRDEFIDYFASRVGFPSVGNYNIDLQATILTARIGTSETVRFWCGELSKVSDENIQRYLEENAYTPVPFHHAGTDPIPPVLEEAMRDIVDALRLDGLSKSEAVQEILSWGSISEDNKEELTKSMQAQKPNYYLKVCDEIYYTFND